MAVKPRPVICMYDIGPISPWNRMRVSESSPSNFISVEGSSCTSPTRFPFDDSRTAAALSFQWHLPLCETWNWNQRIHRVYYIAALLVAILCGKACDWLTFRKFSLLLIRSYLCIIRCEIISISPRIMRKYRISQSGTSMTVTVNDIRWWNIKSRRNITQNVTVNLYTLRHITRNSVTRFLSSLECLHFVPRGRCAIPWSVSISVEKILGAFFIRRDKLITMIYNGHVMYDAHASNTSSYNLWFSSRWKPYPQKIVNDVMQAQIWNRDDV